MKKKYFNVQYMMVESYKTNNDLNNSMGKQQNCGKKLTELRHGQPPSIKEFIIWKEYWNKVTTMTNAEENEKDDSNEI